MIAISEHLRNHGYDPDFYPHTKISGIWGKLREFYDLEAIDERENNMEPPEDDLVTGLRKYKDFDLPFDEFGYEIIRRARDRNPGSPESSAADFDPEEPLSSRKRKAGEISSASGKPSRSSTVEDTEDNESPGPSPAPKSARGARSAKRAASKASKRKEESEEEEESGDQEDDSGDADESEEEETETPASKSGRGGTRGRGRGRTTARGRARGRGR